MFLNLSKRSLLANPSNGKLFHGTKELKLVGHKGFKGISH